MVALLPARRVAQVLSARAGSSAKDVRRRSGLLYLHGVARLDSGRPVILLWICGSVGGPFDGKPHPSSSAPEFHKRPDSPIVRTAVVENQVVTSAQVPSLHRVNKHHVQCKCGVCLDSNRK